jgi:hypothetical protein
MSRSTSLRSSGKFAIHTTRKRLIGVQRQLKAEGNAYRAFEILNLGKYERQHYIGVNPNLREAEQQKQLEEKEAAFVDLILRAYRAEKTDGFNTFNGKKAGRLVAVGPVNLPVTRLFVEEVILECRQKHITRVDILGFEFEMGLFPNVLDEARAGLSFSLYQHRRGAARHGVVVAGKSLRLGCVVGLQIIGPTEADRLIHKLRLHMERTLRVARGDQVAHAVSGVRERRVLRRASIDGDVGFGSGFIKAMRQ